MDDMETRIERAKRFSKIWWQSRADSGKSQEYMALGLGVSKKTIQNWEKGITSPDLFQSSEWFRLLGLNPLHYYLEFLYPDAFAHFLKADDPDAAAQIAEAIILKKAEEDAIRREREALQRAMAAAAPKPVRPRTGRTARAKK